MSRRKKLNFSLIQNPAVALDRLGELRRVLVDVLPGVLNGHKFDMSFWAKPAKKGQRDWKPSLECHTAACMCGWGVILSPKLRGDGLGLDAAGMIEFEEIGWDRQEAFFGVTGDGFDYLFSPDGNCHPYPNNGRGRRALASGIRRLDEALAEAREMEAAQ